MWLQKTLVYEFYKTQLKRSLLKAFYAIPTWSLCPVCRQLARKFYPDAAPGASWYQNSFSLPIPTNKALGRYYLRQETGC
jgi:hypothetical protein